MRVPKPPAKITACMVTSYTRLILIIDNICIFSCIVSFKYEDYDDNTRRTCRIPVIMLSFIVFRHVAQW